MNMLLHVKELVQLTTRGRVITEKIIIAQMLKTSLPSYGTRKFITVFARARH
jgi:hypothetical protein